MISDQILVSAGLLTCPRTLLVLVFHVSFSLIYFPSWRIWSCAEFPPEAQMAVKTRLPATLLFSRNLHLLLLHSSFFSSLPSSSLAADVCASICGFLSPFDKSGPAAHLAEPRLSSLQSSEEVGRKKNLLGSQMWLRLMGQTGEPPAGCSGNYNPTALVSERVFFFLKIRLN